MLSKEEFCKYVKAYREFNTFVDELDKFYVKIWETDAYGWYNNYYVTMLNRLMECEPDEKYGTIVENFLFNSDNSEEDPEEFYNKFVGDKNGQNITTAGAIPIDFINKKLEWYKKREKWHNDSDFPGVNDAEISRETIEYLIKDWREENEINRCR